MNKKFMILLSIFIIIMLFILISSKSNVKKVEEININDIKNIIYDNDYVLIHNGKITPEINSYLKDLNEKYEIKTYNTNLSNSDIIELESNNVTIKDNGYLLYVGGFLATFIDDNEDEIIRELAIFRYAFGYIPESDIYYKVIDKSEEYIKKVNSNEYVVSVFGYNTCSYCNLYLSVVNDVAKKYDLNIYYFDRNNYDKDEYQKVMDIDFSIPGECTQSGAPTSLSQKFDKPLTVISKKGKLVGCIKGYVTEDVLVKKLNEFKLVKEVK